MSEMEQEVIALMMRKTGIRAIMDANLRKPRKERQEEAKRGQSWTLFVNKKGSLCQAVHRTGAIMLFDSPEYLHGVMHKEHAINFFANNMKTFMRDFQ